MPGEHWYPCGTCRICAPSAHPFLRFAVPRRHSGWWLLRALPAPGAGACCDRRGDHARGGCTC
eukprot:10195021-Prorocentrum_lima.AAC.1